MPKTPEEFLARSKVVAARAEKFAKQGDHARAEMLRARAARFAKQGGAGGHGGKVRGILRHADLSRGFPLSNVNLSPLPLIMARPIHAVARARVDCSTVSVQGQGLPKTPEEFLARSKVVAARADKLDEEGEHKRASMLRERAAQLAQRAADGGDSRTSQGADAAKLPRAAPLTTAQCLERAALLNKKATAAAANGNDKRAAALRERVERLTRRASSGDNAPKHAGGASDSAGGDGEGDVSKAPKDMTPEELRKRAALLASKADAAESNGHAGRAGMLRQRVERLSRLAAEGGAVNKQGGSGQGKAPKDMTPDELRERIATLSRNADAAEANGEAGRAGMLRQRVERLRALASGAAPSKRAAPDGGEAASGGGGKRQAVKAVTPEEAEKHAALSKDLMGRAQRAAANGNGERAALLRARSLRQARLAEGKPPGPAPKAVVAEVKAKVRPPYVCLSACEKTAWLPPSPSMYPSSC